MVSSKAVVVVVVVMGFLTCIALVSASGDGRKIPLPYDCLDDCSQFNDCNGACVLKGYPHGGQCIKIIGSHSSCCCNKY
ncbi:hypothetical protein G4B88_011373 [Cannabis sativa]|uniref:Uncharacterized protein n=1 Tax=Cannabis sativa TaxID=3483 RepID=A0A7J6GHK8_CANSA|nr:hypothetical protein G4B88_011373 [Cannabis sativa]